GALPDLSAAAAPPCRQTLSKPLRRRRYRHHHDIGVGPARRCDHGSRHVGDYIAAGANIVVNAAIERIAMTVRLPMHGVGIPRTRLTEGIIGYLLIVLEGR